jgi:hypothetical protein
MTPARRPVDQKAGERLFRLPSFLAAFSGQADPMVSIERAVSWRGMIPVSMKQVFSFFPNALCASAVTTNESTPLFFQPFDQARTSRPQPDIHTSLRGLSPLIERLVFPKYETSIINL